MEPLYRRIEFCRNAESLWGKLKSGRYDWLGVHPDGKFVLGSPPVKKGSRASASPTLIKEGAPTGEHGVRIDTLAISGPSATWYPTEAEAQAEFKEQVRRLKDDRNGPGIVRVRLVEQREIVDEEFIVRPIPTYQ